MFFWHPFSTRSELVQVKRFWTAQRQLPLGVIASQFAEMDFGLSQELRTAWTRLEWRSSLVKQVQTHCAPKTTFWFPELSEASIFWQRLDETGDPAWTSTKSQKTVAKFTFPGNSHHTVQHRFCVVFCFYFSWVMCGRLSASSTCLRTRFGSMAEQCDDGNSLAWIQEKSSTHSRFCVLNWLPQALKKPKWNNCLGKIGI